MVDDCVPTQTLKSGWQVNPTAMQLSPVPPGKPAGAHWQVESFPQVSPERQPALHGSRQTPSGFW